MNEHVAHLLERLDSGDLNTGELIHDAVQMVRYKTDYQELSREDEARIAVVEIYAREGQYWSKDA